ncbi:hypothetical protein P7K49_033853 [Saguinus oedipus]|uniref:Uncharacterized protein n=1 Tax=Saguinus oedipus TaxID=9490 RepID=A0ABQ9TT52_SAGOE|nr:hypothetical protein P7K49_033853 [Saguinus oedipus]
MESVMLAQAPPTHTQWEFCPDDPSVIHEQSGKDSGKRVRSCPESSRQGAAQGQAGRGAAGPAAILQPEGPGAELRQRGLRSATGKRTVWRRVQTVSQPALPCRDVQPCTPTLSQLPGCPGILAVPLPGPADHRATKAVTKSLEAPEVEDEERWRRIPSSGGSWRRRPSQMREATPSSPIGRLMGRYRACATIG